MTVDDASGTQTVTATIGDSSITGLAPAPISYTAINQLTVYGGKGSHNQYTITGSVATYAAPGTTFYDESATDTVTVRSSSGKVAAMGQTGDAITVYGSTAGGSVLNAYPQNADIGNPGVYDKYMLTISRGSAYQLFIDMGQPGDLRNLYATRWSGWNQTFSYVSH